MNPVVQPFLTSFDFTDRGVRITTGDLSADNALHRMRDGEGASILWTLGHLYEYRRLVLAAMDVETESPYTSLFLDAPASEGAGYPELNAFLKDWSALAETLQQTLAVQPPEAFLTAEGEKKDLFTAIHFYVWHEASHMGVINVIRKELGHPSASEIVIARMKKQQEEDARTAADA